MNVEHLRTYLGNEFDVKSDLCALFEKITKDANDNESIRSFIGARGELRFTLEMILSCVRNRMTQFEIYTSMMLQRDDPPTHVYSDRWAESKRVVDELEAAMDIHRGADDVVYQCDNDGHDENGKVALMFLSGERVEDMPEVARVEVSDETIDGIKALKHTTTSIDEIIGAAELIKSLVVHEASHIVHDRLQKQSDTLRFMVDDTKVDVLSVGVVDVEYESGEEVYDVLD